MKKVLVLITALMIGLSFGCTSVPHTSIHTKKERITGTRVTNNCSVPVLVGYVAAYKNKEDYKKSELKKLKKKVMILYQTSKHNIVSTKFKTIKLYVLLLISILTIRLMTYY